MSFGRPQTFRGIDADQWTSAVQDEGEWRNTAIQGVESFIVKWTTAKKARARLQHSLLCPNVTEKTEKRIAQSKRARVGSLAIIASPQEREPVSSGHFCLPMIHCLSPALRLFFILFRFCLLALLAEFAALRSIVPR